MSMGELIFFIIASSAAFMHSAHKRTCYRLESYVMSVASRDQMRIDNVKFYCNLDPVEVSNELSKACAAYNRECK